MVLRPRATARRALPRRAVGDRRACASLVASFAAGVPVRNVGDIGPLIATLPRAAARSPISEASLSATKAGTCGREALIQLPRISKSSGAVPRVPPPSMPCRVDGRSSTSERAPVASFAAGAMVWNVGGAIAVARSTPACSSPPSIALRPRAAARSPMSGAARWATKGAARGRETLIQSHRAVRLRRLPHERRGSRLNGGHLFTPSRSSPPPVVMRLRLPARSPMGVAPLQATEAAEGVSDERARPWRVVRRGRRGVERRRALRFARLVREQRPLASHRPAHRHLPLRCARALQRARRCAARRCRRGRRPRADAKRSSGCRAHCCDPARPPMSGARSSTSVRVRSRRSPRLFASWRSNG
jgi:hypothetical protein